MIKMPTTRHDALQDNQGKALADFFICGGRRRPVQDSGAHHLRESEAQSAIDDLFPSQHPHSTKRSRQAMSVAVHMSMDHHGWKKTGETSSLWKFEHRWPHLRDRAEGRNHRLPSK